MRIPPFYKIPSWQRFFAGVIIGMIIGFAFFLALYGVAQERQMTTILEQKGEIKDLKKRIKVLEEDKKEKNEKLQDVLTVQEITIDITVPDKYQDKVNRLTRHELESKIKEQLLSLVNRDLQNVFENRQLIDNTIEGRSFTVDDRNFQFEVVNKLIYTDLRITVSIIEITEDTSKTSGFNRESFILGL